MTRQVIFSQQATDDLVGIYDYISEKSGSGRALAYVERIRAYCTTFSDFPERGKRRDDIRPDLRIVGFERRIAIAFDVSSDIVTIDRILYGGRDLERAFSED